MSSWLSLNPFKSQQQEPDQQEEDSEQEEDQPSVKEDLSQLGKTLSRQLWGVASFLAPPPSSVSADPPPRPPSPSSSSSQTLLGIRNDFAEISGSLKSGFSLISTNKAVNEISRLASNLLQFDNEEKESSRDEDSGSGVVGITEEALQFVEEISLLPECWVDFPLPLDDYDFDMSSAQKEHVSAVEHLCRSLEDLRMKLCPGHMSEEHFWMIYFVLLHPRLNKHSSELLSTAQAGFTLDISTMDMPNKCQDAANIRCSFVESDGTVCNISFGKKNGFFNHVAAVHRGATVCPVGSCLEVFGSKYEELNHTKDSAISSNF